MRSGFVDSASSTARVDILRGDDAAVVNVGEERDAQTVERGRQSGHRQRRFRHADTMALVCHTVGDGAGEPTDAGGEHALERRRGE